MCRAMATATQATDRSAGRKPILYTPLLAAAFALLFADGMRQPLVDTEGQTHERNRAAGVNGGLALPPFDADCR